MAKKFLVVLKERDRIQEVLTVLEPIVTRGAKVIFLVSYPINSWAWFRNHWITTESVRKAMSNGTQLMTRYSGEEQKRLAEIRIASARQALENIGADVSVILHNGLHRVLRDYIFDADLRLLLISTANGNVTLELVRLLLVLLRRVKSRGFISFMPSTHEKTPQHGGRGFSSDRRNLHACDGF